MSDNHSTGVEYRDIPGFPGYRAGDDGSVWSCWRKVGRGVGNGTKAVLDGAWRRLAPGAGTRGHLIVTLCPGRHTKMVHTLILEAFIGPRPEGMECCHNDGNPANNALLNLRWDTFKANQADRVIHGTDIRGSRHSQAKLTEEAVRAILADWAANPSNQRALARKHGVHQSTIHLIVNGKIWKHVKPHAS